MATIPPLEFSDEMPWIPGPGVPYGGATGQVLAKKSDDDLDTEWIDPEAAGLPPAATQGEMEAGTEPGARTMSPLGVAQAIAALASTGPGSGVQSVQGKTDAHITLTPADLGAATEQQGALADTAVQPGALADVATSGSYDDLSGKPFIPSTAAAIGAAAASHSHTADALTDASEVGKAVMRATDAAAARVALGIQENGEPAPDVNWGNLTGKPAVVAAGATAAAARAEIGAGTSNLAVGAGAGDAKAGDWKPEAADISDSGTVGRDVLKASTTSAARDAIGALGKGDSDDQMRVVKNGTLVPLPVSPGGGAMLVTHTTPPVDHVDTDNPYLYYNQGTGEAKIYLRTAQGVYIEMGSTSVEPGTPPEEVDPNTMMLGINMSSLIDYARTFCYNNLMWTIRHPQRISGTGDFWITTDGEFFAENQGDRFEAYLCTEAADRLPHGEYTVLNPTGQPVDFGGITVSGANTDSVRTFTIDENSVFLSLKWNGNLSNSPSSIAIIFPGGLTAWQNGEIFRQDFLDYYQGLGCKALRAMCLTEGSFTTESEWSDRQRAGTFIRSSNNPRNLMPYEHIFDICNRFHMHPWLCIPPRATQGYAESLAELADQLLDSDLKVFVETGNETWNSGAYYASNGVWIEFLDYTRYEATIENDVVKRVAHGLSNGDVLRTFPGEGALTAEPKSNWRVEYSNTNLLVTVIDSDSFTLSYKDTATPPNYIPIDFGSVKNILYINVNEPGKVSEKDKSFGLLSKSHWEAFDSKLTRPRVVHVLATQLVNAGATSRRLSGDGVRASVDFIAGAPYYGGAYAVAKFTRNGTSLTYSTWTHKADHSVSIYPVGTALTSAEVIKGDTALYFKALGKKDSAEWSSSYTSVLPDDQVEYDAYVAWEVEGLPFYTKVTLSPVDEKISLPDVPMRQLLDEISGQYTATRESLTGMMSVQDAPPAICYEGGLDHFQGSPAGASAPKVEYLWSEECGKTIVPHIYAMQELGYKAYFYFGDVTSGAGFGISRSYADTVSYRYQALASFNGDVTGAPLQEEATQTHSLQELPPGTPPVVLQLSDDASSYELLLDVNSRGYALDNNSVVLASAGDLDYGGLTEDRVLVRAKNEYRSKLLTINFVHGNPWFEIDAVTVWDVASNGPDPTQFNLRRASGSIIGTERITDGTYIDGAWYPVTGGTGVEIRAGLSSMPAWYSAVILRPTSSVTSSYSFYFAANDGGLRVSQYLGNIRFYPSGGSLSGSPVVGSLNFDVNTLMWAHCDGDVISVGQDNVKLGEFQVVDNRIMSSTTTFIGNGYGFLAFQHVRRQGMSAQDAQVATSKMLDYMATLPTKQ